MHEQSIMRLVFGILILAIMVPFLSQCGVKQPKVENKKFSSPFADHSRFTDPCGACHENRRLGPSQDTALVAHGYGRECQECHEYSSASPSWSPKFYSHSPTPSSCWGCHSLATEIQQAAKPTAHNNGQPRGDCGSCHSYGTWVIGG